MSLSRTCSRSACSRAAVATLTYVYADQTAVVGPLATYAEPHTYDLCAEHATGLTAPRGWDIVRLAGDYSEPPPTHDDLLALADAVREAGRPRVSAQSLPLGAVPARYAASGPGGIPAPSSSAPWHGERDPGPRAQRRGHLRVITDAEADTAADA